MSPSGDYHSEMIRRDQIEDAAIEAFFAGNGAGGEMASLAAFAEEVRAVAQGPVPAPSAQLATMLAHGFSTEQSPAAGAVPAPVQRATRRSRRVAVAELFGNLGMAAKAALGIGIVAAGITGAGAAGALPGPAQDALAAAVEAATPFSFPDSASDSADFGDRVSTDATDGGVDGKEISEEAKENGDAHRADGGAPDEPGQNGLDRAGETPAAGHVPTAPPAGGQPDGTGPDQAGGTPAADHLPEAVPAGPPAENPPADAGTQSSTGLTTASSTPATDRLPGSVPGAP